jgi:hypothetical protein
VVGIVSAVLIGGETLSLQEAVGRAHPDRSGIEARESAGWPCSRCCALCPRSRPAQIDKSLSTRGRGTGTQIEAPILAYLIETAHGRILYDVGCDYAKIADPRSQPLLRSGILPLDRQRCARRPHSVSSATAGATAADVDVVFVGHLHFDRAGGLCDVCGAEVHVQQDNSCGAYGLDIAVFPTTCQHQNWKVQQGEYDLVPGVRAVASPATPPAICLCSSNCRRAAGHPVRRRRRPG